MLRQLQIGINRRTVTVNDQVKARQLAEPQSRGEHTKLGQRQAEVREMTEQLKQKLTRGGGGGGHGPGGGGPGT